MHHTQLKAAVSKYLPMIEQGTSTEEIMEALALDEKGYSAEDINKIMEALTAPDAGKKPDPAKEVKQAEEKPTTINKVYEEWKVKAVVSQKLNLETGEKDRIVTFEKDAQAPIRKTSISPDKAEILNTQSENTLLRLFEVK